MSFLTFNEYVEWRERLEAERRLQEQRAFYRALKIEVRSQAAAADAGWETGELEPGDALFREKIGMSVAKHWGLYLGMFAGSRWVVDGQRDGVRIVPLEVFSAGLPTSVRAHAHWTPRAVVVERALESIGKKDYDLLRNNCEALVNFCQRGERRSEQVEKAIGVAGLAALVAIVARFG